ncbi:unnamed protein product [Leptidea sinapis]|uniref:Uncharacterized protein n=1 Tax=Leptidea sinapis TaxID=189913 RepID=A0A5E4Q2E8_9NEOP|nr:unnamed protein product [Leptidea sinapis]VVC91425.1 unnamed protein product [Leptidea sinapis]
MKYLSILLCIVYLSYIHSYVFPTVPKCKLTDSVCLKSSFQKALPFFLDGIPELGIEKMDPLLIEEKEYEIGGLKFLLKDTKMTGMKTLIFDKVSFDLQNKIVNYKYHVATSSMIGKYEAGGKILLLPIQGNGLFTLE